MIKTIRKFTSKIYKIESDLFGNLSSREGLAFTMNTSGFIKFNRSLLNFQSFKFSNSERDLFSIDIKALHEAAELNKKMLFIRQLPLLRRQKPTLQIAEIFQENFDRKKDKSRVNLKLPILTQAFGAGKTVFMMNLPELFEEYCPENKELKESYHIYVDLNNLPIGPEPVLNRFYSLIFSSFLGKYGAVPENFPRSIDRSNIDLLSKFIRRNNFPEEYEQLLRQLKVTEDKINLIVEDFKVKKFSLIIFEIDEFKKAEEEKIYSEKEIESINKKIQANGSNINLNKDNLSNLIRLYYFWDQISILMRVEYFELIVSGKGTSGLLGKKIIFQYSSPSSISQIILDPLTQEDIRRIIEEIIAKSNMIDKKVNLSDLTEKIYMLTNGHPLYVGLAIFYSYKSIIKQEKYFNLEKALKDDGEIIDHVRLLLESIRVYKGVLGLRKFFYDILNGIEMKKNTRHKIREDVVSYIPTTELLDNLGISYSNGKASIIKPVLPGIFKREFMESITENFEYGSIEKGLYEEKLFGECFLSFSRYLHDNPTDIEQNIDNPTDIEQNIDNPTIFQQNIDNPAVIKKNIDIKKMFSFLKKFPNFNKSEKFEDKCIPLPRIIKRGKDKFHEEYDIAKLKTIHISNYNKLLGKLQQNVLYRHRELSSGCDYAYVRGFNTNNKLFLFFQIKNAETVDLNKEYDKVFKDTELKPKIGCFYRLIIFNSLESEEVKFERDEAYKVYSYKNKKLDQLSGDYDEMKNKVLVFYVNPSEIEKFKRLVEVV